jgi:hypothetical protein
MEAKVKNELSQQKQTAFHSQLLQHCKALVDMSRSDMSKYYDRWEASDLVYRGERFADEEDKKACKTGAPSKIVIPLTYAQIQTFVSFGMGLLQQREHFFELEGTGEEDHRAAKLGEALLDQNLEANQFTTLLYQFLLNIGRFSLGVIKHSWVRETESVWVEEEVQVSGFQPMRLLGQLFNPAPRVPEMKQVKKEQVAYMGNRLESVSPFCFYPDTRFPLSKFQQGEFCGSETEMSMTQLRKGEKDGLYAGVKFIEKLSGDKYLKRQGQRFGHYRQESTTAKGQIESTVIVTSVQLEITPSKFKLSDGTTLGSSNDPEKWIVEYANDSRVIRAEPLGYVHNHFTYSLGQFSPDEQSLVNETIAEMVGHLQAVIDWFVNAHITNVRKHISNRLVVDPAGVMFEDIRDHKPVIRLKPGASNTGVDRYVKQLNVSDVTRGHISDVQTLMQFVYMTTAISDNSMGQVNSGRRSAREISNTASASGNRLRTVIKLIYDGCLKPLGKDLLSNLRDGLDEDTFVTVSGTEFPDWEAYTSFTMKDGRTKVKVNRTNLAGNFDFKVFEGILPSDKFAQAETIENTLMALMKNPQGLPILTQVLGYDPKKLFTEVLELRGIKHPDRFKIDEVRMQELQLAAQRQQQLENGPTNPTGTEPGIQGSPTNGAVQAPSGPFESLLA